MKLAPFARALVAERMAGRIPAGHLVFGHVVVTLDSWKWGPPGSGAHRIVIPKDADPARLDWSCLVGLVVELVYDSQRTPAKRFDATRAALLAAQPARLSVTDMDILRAPAH